MAKIKNIFSLLLFALIGAGISAATSVFAVPPASMYSPGETLNPVCSPGDANCTTFLGWNVNTDDGFVYNDTDLVGIGTDTPTRALTVMGDVLTRYDGASDSLFAQGDLTDYGGDEGFMSLVTDDIDTLNILGALSLFFNGGDPFISAHVENATSSAGININAAGGAIDIDSSPDAGISSNISMNEDGEIGIYSSPLAGSSQIVFDLNGVMELDASDEIVLDSEGDVDINGDDLQINLDGRMWVNSDGVTFSDTSPANTDLTSTMGVGVGDPGPGVHDRTGGFIYARLTHEWESGYYNIIDSAGNSKPNIYWGTLDNDDIITDVSRVSATEDYSEMYHDGHVLYVNEDGFEFDGGNFEINQTTHKNTLLNVTGIGITPSTGDRLEVFGNIRVGTSDANGCLKDFSGGTITGTCSSDSRLKENIIAVPHVLDALVHIPIVTYTWNSVAQQKGFKGETEQMGVLADDVEKVLPDLVSTDEAGYKQVNYARLPLLALKAIQELNEKISTNNPVVEMGGTIVDLFSNIKAWLASAANGLEKIFTQSITTHELCIADADGETCLNRDQIDAILSSTHSNNDDVQNDNSHTDESDSVIGYIDAANENGSEDVEVNSDTDSTSDDAESST